MAAVERLYKITTDASQAVRELRKLNKSTANIDRNFNKMQQAARLATKAVAAVGTAMAGFTAVKGVTDVANQINLLEASFGALTGSAERGADMIQRSFKLVEETGAGFEDVATSLQRLTIGMEDLGAQNEQIEGVAEAFIKIGRIGGTSMFSTNQALVQFTQGLASGRLQGDELRSILERVPLITSLISKEMGVARGQIKELGKQGKVTADIMVNALLKALPEIREQFEQLPQISEQAIARISAQWTLLQKDFAESTGLDTGFVQFLEAIADAVGRARITLANFLDLLNSVKDVFGSLGQSFKNITTPLQRTQILFAGLGIALAAAVPKVIAMFTALSGIATLKLTGLGLVSGILAIAAATLLVVDNWDFIKLTLTTLAPQWIEKTKIAFYRGLDLIGKAWHELKGVIVSTFDDTIIKHYQKIWAALQGTKFQIPWISGFEDGAEYTQRFTDKIKESTDSIEFWKGQYVKGLDEIEARRNKIDEDWKDPEPIVVPVVIDTEKLEKELQKLYESLDPATKIFNTFNAQVKTLQAALKAKLIDEAEYERLIELFDKMKDSALTAADPLTKMREKLSDLMDTVDPSRVPIRDFAEQIDTLNLALAAGDVDPEKYAQIAISLAKIRDEALNAEDETARMFRELKTAVDGFARDFTNELVDSLETGELKFKDFAKNVLKTITKMMLNKIFTQFFDMLAFGQGGPGSGGGIAGWLGIGQNSLARGLTATPMPAYAGPMVGTFADSAVSKMLVGSPLPGYGVNTARSKVNVIVNNNANAAVEVVARERGDEIDIELMIESQVAKSISQGGLDRAMANSYGLRRKAF